MSDPGRSRLWTAGPWVSDERAAIVRCGSRLGRSIDERELVEITLPPRWSGAGSDTT